MKRILKLVRRQKIEGNALHDFVIKKICCAETTRGTKYILYQSNIIYIHSSRGGKHVNK